MTMYHLQRYSIKIRRDDKQGGFVSHSYKTPGKNIA